MTKRQARHLGRLRSGHRNATLTCPCCRRYRKGFKRMGNYRIRTIAKYRPIAAE